MRRLRNFGSRLDKPVIWTKKSVQSVEGGEKERGEKIDKWNENGSCFCDVKSVLEKWLKVANPLLRI